MKAKKNVYVPSAMIKRIVCEVTEIPISKFLTPRGVPGAKKRELVEARQISMTLCILYTRKSLAYIGLAHGGRDHATVMHAHKAINDYFDTNYTPITGCYNECESRLLRWAERDMVVSVKPALKCKIIKSCIKNKVPLDVRQHILSRRERELEKIAV